MLEESGIICLKFNALKNRELKLSNTRQQLIFDVCVICESLYVHQALYVQLHLLAFYITYIGGFKPPSIVFRAMPQYIGTTHSTAIIISLSIVN